MASTQRLESASAVQSGMKSFERPSMEPGMMIPRIAMMRRQMTGRDTVYLTTFPTVVVPFLMQR